MGVKPFSQCGSERKVTLHVGASAAREVSLNAEGTEAGKTGEAESSLTLMGTVVIIPPGASCSESSGGPASLKQVVVCGHQSAIYTMAKTA
ncbi:hypothetical protein Pan189_11220 [Stratiformator vulcanicus]|uniref:Uncharacterized protein n=1 Tax=Stratiformator vulcanicus TaxID=2527980 RepID=A0A517QYM9_9PLAN|nr:hypothetical protein Pan189_11220 [Stratiformator vulcanicus]